MTDFVQFARSVGLVIDYARPDATIHYYPTVAHPKERRGTAWYDGLRGWAIAHDMDAQVVWFDDPDKKWTEADKREWREKRHAAQLKLLQTHQAAADKARALLETCKTAKHGYLMLKGFADQRALVDPEEALVVPMRDWKTDYLLGVQRIFWDAENRVWVKKYTAGMRAGGAVHKMGSPDPQETWVTEGYADALSLLAAIELTRLRARVVVAFSASNLQKVAPLLPGKVFVFADNDVSGVGQKAAEATGLPWTMSDVQGEDPNDLMDRAGVYAVAAKLMEVRNR